jgi:glycosyltransferase involved in cell wall biosynthesis
MFNPIVLLKNEGPLSHELERRGVTVHLEGGLSTVPYNRGLFKRGALRQVLKVMFSLRKVRKWIYKTQADIVHINTMMMYPYVFPARKLDRKVVVHVREHWPKGENIFQFKLARRLIVDFSNKIVAINKESADMIACPEKTVIVYDWIDFSNRQELIDLSSRLGANDDKVKTLLYLGGFQKIKGALEVVNMFSKRLRQDDLRLLFVGSDDKRFETKGFRAIIKAVLRMYGMPVYSDKVRELAQKDDRIVFIAANNNVKSLLDQSFCLVSFFTKPHANLAVAEAAWLGVPSVAARTPESVEYCAEDNNSSLLFEINNENEFVKALVYAIENEDEIYANAYEKIPEIRRKFDSNRNSTLLNEAYRELFGNKFI